MRTRFEIITNWESAGVQIFPHFPEDNTHIRRDITGAAVIPTPNSTVWEVITEQPDLYRNDPDLYILSEEEITDETIE